MFIGQCLAEQELCPKDLLTGQDATFTRDIAQPRARGDTVLVACPACCAAWPTLAFHNRTADSVLAEISERTALWYTACP